MTKNADEPVSGYDSLVKSLTAEFGDILQNGEDLVSNPKRVISLSPSIDMILRGGITEGSMVLCAGDTGSGKTTLSLWFAAQCQEDDRFVYYLDTEHRLKAINLTGIPHLKVSPDKFKVVRSIKGKILSAEDFISIILQIVHNHPRSLIIVDSASALASAKSLASNEVKSEFRAEGPRLLAELCRRISGVLAVHDNILWMNQHVIADTGFGPATKTTDGGNKIKFASDIRFEARRVQPWKGSGAEPIGQQVSWISRKIALGAPHRQLDGFIRYGFGVDCGAELVELGILAGDIKKSGAWLSTSVTGDELKYQGLEKFANALNSNKELYKKMYSIIMPKMI